MAMRSPHGPRASRSWSCPTTASEGAEEHLFQAGRLGIGWHSWVCPGLDEASPWFLFDLPTVSLYVLMPQKEEQFTTSGHTLRQQEIFRTSHTLPR